MNLLFKMRTTEPSFLHNAQDKLAMALLIGGFDTALDSAGTRDTAKGVFTVAAASLGANRRA